MHPHRAYAANTDVSVEKTKSEIEALLSKHGATQRGVISDDVAGHAAIFFVLGKRPYKLAVPLPTPAQITPKKKDAQPTGWDRWDEVKRGQWVRKTWEQRCRSRWRGVLLILKAKLEHVAMGLSTVEREFLADLMLPNGARVGEEIGTMIEEAVTSGRMPTGGFGGLLLGPGPRSGE